MSSTPVRPLKAPTGIDGLDTITGGGLPRGSVTLVEGGPGCGKTVLALQALTAGARDHGEPGLFVAFEERAERIVAHATSFGWGLDVLVGSDIHFLDAQPRLDTVQAGTFDLGGLLAVIDAQVEATGTRRVVIDALDVVLALLPNQAAVRREVYRLHEFLTDRQLTTIVTAKRTSGAAGTSEVTPQDFMQFMVDCSILLTHDVSRGVAQRSLRVVKYRGSSFDENDAPLLIGRSGIEVAVRDGHERESAPTATSERVSSGVARLDEMLGGGYYRGASVLLTGAPGTAKTTLCGTFVDAACRRGESTLFVSFDSRADEIVRNLASVGIDLSAHLASGLLHMHTARALVGNAETHMLRIRTLARETGAKCLVIDPLSSLGKSVTDDISHSVAERLIDWAKVRGLTLVCTSLLDHAAPDLEGSPLQVSTIADTWLHLSYVVHAGERNRALSIVKSRGTSHSNQVRELVLSGSGVSLTDVYTSGGEVLMGTLRWEKERQVQLAQQNAARDVARRRLELEAEAAALEAQLAQMRRDLDTKLAEMQRLVAASDESSGDLAYTRSSIEQRRRRHASPSSDGVDA